MQPSEPTEPASSNPRPPFGPPADGAGAPARGPAGGLPVGAPFAPPGHGGPSVSPPGTSGGAAGGAIGHPTGHPTGSPPIIPTESTPPGSGGSGPIRTFIAWIVILAVAIGYVALSSIRHADEVIPPGTERISTPAEMNGKLMRSLAQFARDFGQPALMNEAQLASAAPPPESSWIDRLAFAILKADLIDPDAGIAELDNARLPQDAPPEDIALRDAVERHLASWRDGNARSPLEPEQAKRLGWYATVIDGTAPPSRVFVGVMLIGLFMGCVALAGVVIHIAALILTLLGSLRSALVVDRATASRGPLYAETFAVWFVLFVGSQLAAGILVQAIGLAERTEVALGAAFVAFFASLAALVWPIVRGVPWATVREDIGLTRGRGILREALIGPLVYAAGLPIMIAGLIIYLLLRTLFPGTEQASHPIVETFGGGGLGIIAVFAVACIAAPIVEEIAFRGILYRHLRESELFLGRVVAVVLSTVVSSIIFAGIHPQGLLFIPVLGGLATAFCLGREWRGSLISAIVAHALNNAVTLSLGVTIAGG
jgi:membrane protease YdiL (CAAX protease family)